MEIKATLEKPYTENEKVEFIIEQNHNLGYEIRGEEPETLEAWGYTQEEIEQQERERKDMMTLTPADVERALYKAKGMDFDDLKELLATGTGIDLKALAIEFRATTFYRGAMYGSGRLFDIVGQLLGYDSDDIDYLFEHKELPVDETTAD